MMAVTEAMEAKVLASETPEWTDRIPELDKQLVEKALRLTIEEETKLGLWNHYAGTDGFRRRALRDLTDVLLEEVGEGRMELSQARELIRKAHDRVPIR